MKTKQTSIKTLLALGATSTLLLSTQAATLTWDDGDGTDDWTAGANWVGDPATGPVTGDSVILTTTAQIRLDTDFTIASGASLTTTATGTGDELTLQTASVLTLATGGTMDIAFMRPRFSDGGDFNIQAGASLSTGSYGLGTITADISYFADATGVTTWTNTSTNAGAFNIGGDNLTVDLSAYSVVDGNSLTLVDYGAAGALSGAFTSVNIFDSSGALIEDVDYTLDYATDSNITLTFIPEPSSTALFGLGSLALILRRKRS